MDRHTKLRNMRLNDYNARLELKNLAYLCVRAQIKEFVPVYHMQNKHTQSIQVIPKSFQFLLPGDALTHLNGCAISEKVPYSSKLFYIKATY